MASVGSEDGDIGFQIAPMVDVVFVLMIFFMASAGQQVVEAELSINLPGGGVSRKGPSVVSPIIVEIAPDGQVMANNQTHGTPTDKNLTSLRDWLKGNVERFGDESPVIIRPAPQTRHERIMDVLNAVGVTGVTKLTFG
jgi:biopolymer transport protein ExbD